MSNLLQQTLDVMEEYEKAPSDVAWVGSKDGKYAMEWSDFEKIADVDYDSGYGGQEIASDLVIVGDNWWLERGEYDGSEWWNFHTLPLANKPNGLPFSRIVGQTLDELNGG